MKLFIDTAVIEEIRQAASFIDGVTTNPTLIAKSGRRFEDVIKEICKIVDGPISAEVMSEDSEGMIKEAKSLAKIHKNIVVKIPMTIEGIKAVKQLAKEKIKTNVTLVFSANQALIAAKAGAGYVSPFVGRLDDIGQDGMKLVEEIMQIYKNYKFKTEVIVASVRHPIHVKQAAMIGADIATVPFSVLKQLFEHSLTTAGIKRFLEDNKRIKK